MYKNIVALVMDDDNKWREDFRDALLNFGISHVDAVSSMDDAIRCIATKKYDVMVLDTLEDYGRRQISGPQIAFLAVQYGQTPIIFGVSATDYARAEWKNPHFTYEFIGKDTFDTEKFYILLKEKLASKTRSD